MRLTSCSVSTERIKPSQFPKPNQPQRGSTHLDVTVVFVLMEETGLLHQ